MRSVEQAAREWLEAEWFFRLGPAAYSTPAQDRLVRAERLLRKALTGAKDLDEAYQETQRCKNNLSE